MEIITSNTFICLPNGSMATFKNLPQIHYNGLVYGLLKTPVQAIRNYYAAHAVRLGDEIITTRLVPLYTALYDPVDVNHIDLDDDLDSIQDIHDTYDIIRGM